MYLLVILEYMDTLIKTQKKLFMNNTEKYVFWLKKITISYLKEISLYRDKKIKADIE